MRKAHLVIGSESVEFATADYKLKDLHFSKIILSGLGNRAIIFVWNSILDVVKQKHSFLILNQVVHTTVSAADKNKCASFSFVDSRFLELLLMKRI